MCLPFVHVHVHVHVYVHVSVVVRVWIDTDVCSRVRGWHMCSVAVATNSVCSGVHLSCCWPLFLESGPSASFAGLLKASLNFLSYPLSVSCGGRWRMSPGSVNAFTVLMKVAKLNWQNFKGPTEATFIQHVRAGVCFGVTWSACTCPNRSFPHSLTHSLAHSLTRVHFFVACVPWSSRKALQAPSSL